MGVVWDEFYQDFIVVDENGRMVEFADGEPDPVYDPYLELDEEEDIDYAEADYYAELEGRLQDHDDYEFTRELEELFGLDLDDTYTE